MKIVKKLKMTGWAGLSALLMGATGWAEEASQGEKLVEELGRHIAVSGYLGGAIAYEKAKGSASETLMDLTAAKLGFAFNFEKVTAQLNLFTDGEDEVHVLEAFANYDFGNGFFVEGGRYQSWIGYEAFDLPDQLFLTNGMKGLFDDSMGLALMPDVNEGVKVGYAKDGWTFAASFVDSIYANMFSGDSYQGDGDLSNGFGTEWNATYEGDKWAFSATLGYERSKENDFGASYDAYIADVWAQWQAGENTTVAAEFFFVQFNVDGAAKDFRNYFGLLLAKQQLGEKWSLAGRVSAGKSEGDPVRNGEYDYWMVAVAPTFAVTENLSVVAELSFTKHGKDAKADFGKNAVFAGVQAVFKF